MTESDRLASSSGSALALRPFPFHGDGVTAIVTTRHCGVSAGVYASLNLGGVAHCGRRGAVLGVLPRTVETMRGRFGCRAEDLLVGIGPAIGADSYEIGDAEAAQVAAVFGAVGAPGAPGLLRPTRPGHATFDLVAALRVQLRDAGIEDRNVHAMGVDTRASTEDFFSDGAARPCGRFMAVTVLTR